MYSCQTFFACLGRLGPRFNIKMLFYQYRKSHGGDNTVVRSSYLHKGIIYAGKTWSFYWIGPLMFMKRLRPCHGYCIQYELFWATGGHLKLALELLHLRGLNVKTLCNILWFSSCVRYCWVWFKRYLYDHANSMERVHLAYGCMAVRK